MEIKLDQLTVGQAKELARMFAQTQAAQERQAFGYSVVVLDRGFVYVGDVERKGDMLHIKDARNIRYWGTERGLHQLVLEGPNNKTKLDPAANVQAPMRAVISIHESDRAKWNK